VEAQVVHKQPKEYRKKTSTEVIDSLNMTTTIYGGAEV